MSASGNPRTIYIFVRPTATSIGADFQFSFDYQDLNLNPLELNTQAGRIWVSAVALHSIDDAVLAPFEIMD